MSTSQKRATIVDVANLAGVSIGTVSRVLNSSTGLESTRDRVMQAVAQLHYVPNHLARSLKRQTTEQIALVVPDVANPVYVAMAKAVQQEARSRGYRLSLISTEDLPGEEEFALQSLEQRRVDGVIFCSLKPTAKLIARLQGLRDRVCVIGHLPEDALVDNVRVDSAAGVALAVQHLLDGGRRVVGFINGTRGTVPAAVRQQGFERALADNGLAAQPELMASGEFSMAGGYRAVDELLGARPDLDAIFCANDVIALGALRRLRELHLEVPGRIALVGMDDIDLARVSTPSLSSVSLLADRRGQLGAQLLLDRVAKGDDGEPRRLTVVPRLVVRESSTDYIRQEEPT